MILDEPSELGEKLEAVKEKRRQEILTHFENDEVVIREGMKLLLPEAYERYYNTGFNHFDDDELAVIFVSFIENVRDNGGVKKNVEAVHRVMEIFSEALNEMDILLD